MGKSKDEQIARLEEEVERLKAQLDGRREMAAIDDDEDEGMDYKEWVDEQWWPEGATHATIDKQGGCCWWKLKPVLATVADYGWYTYGWKPRFDGGDLVERYYDPSMPMSGPKWRESIIEKPEDK